jgi:glycosyltransferase involved in cell wall biosynthesis
MTDKRFALFIEGPNNGCNFYRIRQPHDFLQKRENFYCSSTVDIKYKKDIDLWMDKADIVFSQSGESEKFLNFIKEGNKKFVFDFDDNIFDISPYNPAYKNYGLSEVQISMPDGSKQLLWKDGENDFDIERNTSKLEVFRDVLKYSDVVTTPSSTLARVFRNEGARNVRVIKNFINFNVWNPINIVKDEFIRIGYQGGHSHYEDWCEISEVIKTIMEKHKNVKLVLMGASYMGLLKNLPCDRVELHDWVSVDAYPYKFRTLNIDIGLCPLSYTLFNTSKSELKWEEYSALKIPTIASNIAPYSLAIKHNETGLLASNTKEWTEYLENLITDHEFRARIGQKANDFVKEHYDMEKGVIQYEDCFKALYQKELLVS